jgi:hypothetical protein
MPRKKVPASTEGKLLLQCRRRCAICFGLHHDSGVKRGQIAHLDQDPNNNDINNLAYLCLEHHDLYDSTSRQSKRISSGEVKVFKAELEEALAAARQAPISLAPEENEQESWEGMYRWERENASAEIEIELLSAQRYIVRGIAFWGTTNPGGPGIGEIEAEIQVDAGRLLVPAGDAMIVLTRTLYGLVAEESRTALLPFGLNVSFAGLYEKIARGADAMPQPAMRSFESEFWPEEGIPVFVAKFSTVPLYARPSSDAPIMGKLDVQPGSRIQFTAFRYRTLRPGRVLAHRPGLLCGRNLGPTDYVSRSNYYDDGGEGVAVRFNAGDQLEYLQYRAEGTGFLRWQGLVLDSMLAWGDAEDALELVSEPVAESWVQVRDEDHQQSGWILADEFLDEVERAF